MPALRTYANLGKLRMRRTLGSADTADDQRLLEKLRSATAEIETYTQIQFVPTVETRNLDYQTAHYLDFRSHYLLSMTSIVDGTGKTIQTAAMILLGAQQALFNGSTSPNGPFYGVEIDMTKDIILYTVTPIRSIAVTGAWGYHDDWANAFHASNVTVQDNPLTSGATTITTSTNNSTITDTWGQSYPATANAGIIQPGHLIQIDSEWMWVVAVPSTTQLTVLRGQQGTTAASHAQGTAISVYEAPGDVQDACVELAAYLLARDSVDFTESATVPVGFYKAKPSTINTILARLDKYKKTRVGR
jgi:hypothetical protein